MLIITLIACAITVWLIFDQNKKENLLKEQYNILLSNIDKLKSIMSDEDYYRLKMTMHETEKILKK